MMLFAAGSDTITLLKGLLTCVYWKREGEGGDVTGNEHWDSEQLKGESHACSYFKNLPHKRKKSEGHVLPCALFYYGPERTSKRGTGRRKVRERGEWKAS